MAFFRMDAPETRRRLSAGGGERAFLDLREEGPYSRAQPLFAVNLPLSRLELDVGRLVPRKTVPVWLFDDGDGLAEQAALTLAELGYGDITIIEGGLDGWRKAGGELFRDVNVPSKSFGEWVETHRHTPMIDATELKALQDQGASLVVLDSRPFHEYQRMTIPGSIDCPGAELVLRARELAPSPETLVVVNCAGRTRSIIGAQSLINARLPNPVRALRNGTIGWTLAGFQVEVGASRKAPKPGFQAFAWARAAARHVAEKAGVRPIDEETLTRLEAEDDRTLFRFDVCSPEEHAATPWPGFAHAPGGQLVQATDEYVGVLGARIVLADDDRVRANMTASWLRQLGWEEVYVLDGTPTRLRPQPAPPALPNVPAISPQALVKQLQQGAVHVLDLATSPIHAAGHVPGARFLIRSRLGLDLRLENAPVVITSPDGRLARLAFAEIAQRIGGPISVLDGGTNAWAAAGLPLDKGISAPLSTPDDVYKRPYEGTDNDRAAMEGYIAWELELVDQIRRDGTARFRPI